MTDLNLIDRQMKVMLQRCTRIALLGTVLMLSSSPAYAYYGIAEYVSALVAFLVVFDFIIYGATLGIIIFTPLGRKSFYGAIWAASGLIALALYLLDLDTLFAISFLWPPLLLVWVLINLFHEPAMAERRKLMGRVFLSRNPDSMVIDHLAFWLFMLFAQGISLVAFAVLADLSQWVIQSPRDFVIDFFLNRWTWFWLTLVALVASLVVWWIRRPVNLTVLLALCAFLVLNAYSGWFNPGLMFRSQQWSANFVGFDMVDQVLKDSDEVIVVEINGDARAFPDLFITQPHIAGDIIGGEEVVMTYCGLSHLGIAYAPFLNGQRLDLKVMSQLENNLVMWDAVTGIPIQQISGKFERQSERAKEYPHFRMTYGVFKKLFPMGYVYYNPVASLGDQPIKHYWDHMTRLIMFHSIDFQHNDPNKPVFPTLDLKDSRLPWKEKVYGIRNNGDAVAYTKAFLTNHPFVRTKIGGAEMIIAYDAEHGVVTPFYADGYTGTSVDVYGNTDDGRKLRRVEGLLSEVFWMIWAHFEKGTDVNRT
ncbi:MAG: DUF3179 domain-containing protein [Gammaproteobacteria bacterium]|nr:MAG: DUF3179 domain-containing protein [Gammaproteobacteria bacterium]